MRVNYYNIHKEFKRVENIFINKIKTLGLNANFILGKNLYEFEKKITRLLRVKYVIGVANGSDAIEISLKSLGISKDDEVITVSNSFISTANSILNIGAKVKFIDIDDTYNLNPDLLEKKITKKTKAIIPVHLNGMPCCMNKIIKIAKKFKLYVIEDSAQAILTKYNNRYVGTLGDIGCFSLHPTKTLGVIGDGGFVTTNNKKLYKKMIEIRNHGINQKQKNLLVGRNSRLDEIQSIFALEKIKFLKKDVKKRIDISKTYNNKLKNIVTIPYQGCCKSIVHSFHRYVIRTKKRDALFGYLKRKGIDVKIHYKINIHDQPVYRKKISKEEIRNLKKTNQFSKEILSLPCNHFMTKKEIDHVVNSIKSFFSS